MVLSMPELRNKVENGSCRQHRGRGAIITHQSRVYEGSHARFIVGICALMSI